MDNQTKVRVGEILRNSAEDLREAGNESEADTVVAVWDTCFGGCGFNLSEKEYDVAAQISKLLFFSPSSPKLLLSMAAGRIEDSILRAELRKIADNMTPGLSFTPTPN